jgi:hypothetical protein
LIIAIVGVSIVGVSYYVAKLQLDNKRINERLLRYEQVSVEEEHAVTTVIPV